MPNKTCPPPNQFHDFLCGLSPQDEWQRTYDHLETCTECHATLADLNLGPDPDLVALRDELTFSPGASPLAKTQVDAPRERWRALTSMTADQPAQADSSIDAPLSIAEYDKLERIGKGGMGTVFKGKHRYLKRIDAIKIVSPERLGSAEMLRRFEREMHVVGQLDHPGIVRALGAGQADGRYYLAMQYINGPDLAAIVKKLGPLKIADAAEIIRQAAMSLQHASERGLIHRDIKPSNVLLDQDGSAKLLDFGLAILNDDNGARDITSIGMVLGTPDFMAPEQIEGIAAVSTRSDIYSLGCTLFFLLTGQRPFQHVSGTPLGLLQAHVNATIPDAHVFRQDTPPPLAAITQRMMAKSPHDRYESAASIAAALKPFCTAARLVDLHAEYSHHSIDTPAHDALGGLPKIANPATAFRFPIRSLCLAITIVASLVGVKSLVRHDQRMDRESIMRQAKSAEALTGEFSPSRTVTGLDSADAPQATQAISGTLFCDDNGNGVRDAAEFGVPGFDVALWQPEGSIVRLRHGLEPDDYPEEMNVSDINPLVRLTAVGTKPWTAAVSVDDRSESSTGTHVFQLQVARDGKPDDVTVWQAKDRELRASFSAPTSFVSIDIVANSSDDDGRLTAYDAAGQLIERVERVVERDQPFVTLSISSHDAKIASIVASGAEHGIRLDNLQFDSLAICQTAEDGSFRIPNVPPGDYELIARRDADAQATAAARVAKFMFPLADSRQHFDIPIQIPESQLSQQLGIREGSASSGAAQGIRQRDRDHHEATLKTGLQYCRRAQFPEAEDVFDRLRKENQQAAILGLGWMRLWQGRPYAASLLFEKLEALDEGSLDAAFQALLYEGIGKAQLARGNRTDAYATFRELLTITADSEALQLHSMEAHAALGDVEAAKQAAENAAKFDPTSESKITRRLNHLMDLQGIDEDIREAQGFRTSDVAVVQTLPIAKFDSFANRMTDMGFFLIKLRPYHTGSDTRVAAIFHQQSGTIRIVGEVEPAALERRIAVLQAEGLVLIDVAGYYNGVEDQYRAVLVSDTDDVGPASALIGVAHGEQSDRHRRLWNEGFLPMARQMFRSANGQFKHCGVWLSGHGDAAACSVRHGDGVLSLIADQVPMIDVDLVLGQSSGVLLSGCFHQDADLRTHVCMPTDVEQHLRQCRKRAELGEVPLGISVVFDDRDAKWSATSVWRVPAELRRLPAGHGP